MIRAANNKNPDTNLVEQDKQQRQFALDASKSFIVQAPAGSGKTELLIQRFLTLLINVNKPEEILAITFTKKAANEMRTRVIKALKHALHEPEPISAHAKQTWALASQVLQRDQKFNWNLIDNPNQLRIQTIDSLCSHLTKQLPLLSHFGSQPDIAENADILYRTAVREVLMHVEENFEWSQAISHLLLHLDNDLNKLHDLLISLLAKRDQWLPYIQFNTDNAEIKKQLENHLAMVVKDSLNQLSQLFPKELSAELLNIIRYAADNLARTKPDSDVIACRDLTELPGSDPKNKNAWNGIANFLLTEKGDWRKSFDARIGIPAASSFKNQQEKSLAADFKERMVAVITRLYDHDDLRISLNEIEYLPEPFYQDAQWEILQSLLFVLKIVAAQLRVTFQLYGQIDFIENAQAALLALGNDETPTDLALALDYQIKHILVDEFQDTSLTQYQLLEKLITGWENNDGRTLFVVGDPMQSIYRFREAEVGLFIRMRSQGIGHVKLIPLTLSVNFRSAEKIVEWNNMHFSRIFPSFNDMATGAVTYSPSVASQNSENADVHIQGYLDSEQSQPEKIVALIQATTQQFPNEKIAILVRSRPHLKDIIPALKKANIPYRAVDIDPLASRQSIHDLLSLTCALLHPADRISWLALLRAPWCGLSLADLLIIAGNNPYINIWEQITKDEIIQRLSENGRSRLNKVIPILKTKINERERSNLRFWVESTWLLLGGPASLQDYHEIDDVNAYFKLLDKCSQQDQILNLDKLKEKINELYAVAQHADANVQIMTVHSAKGLEFDTVILPHLENKPASDSHSLLLWMERPLTNDQVALLLAPIHATGDDKDYIYTYVNRQQSIKSNYEIDRLFYVATTRAKKRLHLFFNVEATEKGEIRIESGSFLKKLWPLIENKQHDLILKIEKPETVAELNSSSRYVTHYADNWHNPVIEKPSTNIAFHNKQTGFQLIDAKPKMIGIVIHRLLQHIAEMGVDWWSKQSQQHDHVIKHQLIQHGILPNDVNFAAKLTHKAIEQTINDERGKWILQKHHDAKSEFAISTNINGVTENFVIDRTFVDETGTRWIIDYKTTAFTRADLDAFLVKEEEKYAEKMQKYAQAMQQLDNNPVRLGLYFPALPAWHEME